MTPTTISKCKQNTTPTTNTAMVTIPMQNASVKSSTNTTRSTATRVTTTESPEVPHQEQQNQQKTP